ncbi:YihD family protein [Vibrio zhugei]|uniref:YihD family protein n=1 Tax=Vibrio zhugei TaxID=2479546 RepID=A0ABV7C705_9VIBR|nr:DUF1040 family protein [Vibrio zhugei]
MTCHRIEELLALLEPEWNQASDQSLVQFLMTLAKEAGWNKPLEELSDDVLIYHLKMRHQDKKAAIPGLQKDYEEDFKTAILRARGLIE